MKIYLIIFLLLIPLSAFTQQIQWAKSFGSPHNDWPHDIKCDNNGNVYVTGIFNIGTAADYCATIKYNLNGDSLWSRKFNEIEGLAVGRNIMFDDSLNVYVSGSHMLKYTSQGDLQFSKDYHVFLYNVCFDNSKNFICAGETRDSVSSRLFSLLKLNKNGDTLWQKIYPQFHFYTVVGLSVDKNNNIICNAYYSTFNPNGTNEVIFKFDPEGNLLWTKTFSGGDQPAAIILDSLNNIIFSGGTRDSANFYGFTTIKYDPEGNIIWIARLPYHGESRDIKFDRQGNIIICGKYENNLSAVFKYTPQGNFVWFQSFGGYVFESSYLCLDSIGNPYIGNTLLNSNGSYCYQIVKYTNNGQLLWKTTYPVVPPPTGFYHLRGINIDKWGNVFATGLREGGIANDDFHTVRVNTITGLIQNQNELPLKYSLSQNYPNPFNPTTRISYELPVSDFVTLKVYDVIGNEIKTLVNEKQNAGGYSVTFEGSALSSGIYFYRLSTESFSGSGKMVLIK